MEKKYNQFISIYIVGNEITKENETYITIYELNPPKHRSARKINFSSLYSLAQELYNLKKRYSSQFIFNTEKDEEDKIISLEQNIQGMIDSIKRTTGIDIESKINKYNLPKNKKINIPGSTYKPFSKKEIEEIQQYIREINIPLSEEIFYSNGFENRN